MKNAPKIKDIGQHLGQLPSIANVAKIAPTTNTGAPAAGTFHSLIEGRAPLSDLSKIPSTYMGIERVFLSNEFLYDIEFKED